MSIVVPIDLTPTGVIAFEFQAFIAGCIFGMVILLVVEARRALMLRGKQ